MNDESRYLAPPSHAALFIAAFVLLLHVVVNATTPYGVHRDEFLYMAMGEHLRLFRMDFPPFIAIVARVSRLLGDSLVAIRILPAVASALIVWLAAHTARRAGGSTGAALLAALCVAMSPLFLRTGSMLQPVVFDQLWWTMALVALARLGVRDAEGAVGDDARSDAAGWLLLGAALGLGLLTKFSVAFLAAGVTAAVLATPLRHALLGPWPWTAALLALAIGAPSIIGQVALGWPVRGQMADLQALQLERVTASVFLLDQAQLGPAVLLALLGAIAPFTVARLRAFRALAIGAIVPFVLLLVMHGKGYYAGPVYPVLFGVGAAALLPITGASWVRWRLAGVAALLVVAYGALTLPFGIPFLPPAQMSHYAQAMGAGTTNNRGQQLSLPQDYADMLGWPAQSEAVARVLARLSAADRARVTVAAGNYGQAGALDFHGRPLGIPPVVSAVGSYWFFGPGTQSGDPTVVLAEREGGAELSKLFESVEVAETVRAPEAEWLVPEERDVVVFVCRRPRMPLAAAWAGMAGRN